MVPLLNLMVYTRFLLLLLTITYPTRYNKVHLSKCRNAPNNLCLLDVVMNLQRSRIGLGNYLELVLVWLERSYGRRRQIGTDLVKIRRRERDTGMTMNF
ncbi:MAG: hypothetical protein [Circoviridae sp.]|nr:MAG: hypothetical protein [Circoviridae sp.]